MTDAASALIIVDVQQTLLAEQEPALRELPDRIAAHVRAREPGYERVIASRFRNLPGSSYDRLVGSDLRRDDEVQLCAPVEHVADVTIDSTTYSSATPDVINLLTGLGSREVHVAGVDTDQCVLATTLTLVDAGFEPVVLTDLCASASGSNCHEAGLLVLRRAIGEERVRESYSHRPRGAGIR